MAKINIIINDNHHKGLEGYEFSMQINKEGKPYKGGVCNEEDILSSIKTVLQEIRAANEKVICEHCGK